MSLPVITKDALYTAPSLLKNVHLYIGFVN